jgi:TonB-dependent SusC/RagA subfamily outer membrane receptor
VLLVWWRRIHRPLGDLNPNDIERVEVLKGAAAATLYGSEATNGVIQIFTKRGHTGEQRTQWNMGLSTGFEELRHNLPTTQFPRFTGPDGTRALDANETMIQRGPYYGLDLSAQGGATRTTYFASTNISKETGSIQPNDQSKAALRLNLTFVPSDKWTVEARSAYVRDRINEIQAGNNWTALLGNALNGAPTTATKDRPYGEAWVPVKDIKSMKTQSDVDRWTGGLTLNNIIRPNITHRLTFGGDAVNDHKSRFFPYAGTSVLPALRTDRRTSGTATTRRTRSTISRSGNSSCRGTSCPTSRPVARASGTSSRS